MNPDNDQTARKFSLVTLLAGVILFGCFLASGASFISAVSINSLAFLSKAELGAEQEKVAKAPNSYHPHYLVALAEETLQQDSALDIQNIKLIQVALEKDAGDSFTWANLSFLKTRQAGKLNQEATQALRKSIELCRLCDPSLLKWRLQYVLATWDNAPEDVRLAVFEGADILRWWHLEYDYLTELREKWERAGIPFQTYQQRVGTQVRPQEIGLPE